MTNIIRGGKSARRAFSLLEMLAVVTILGIIATLVVPMIGVHVHAAKEKACRQYCGDLESAIEKYMFEYNEPPAQLSDLVDTGFYPGVIPHCPAEHTAYTIDPITKRIAGHDH